MSPGSQLTQYSHCSSSTTNPPVYSANENNPPPHAGTYAAASLPAQGSHRPRCRVQPPSTSTPHDHQDPGPAQTASQLVIPGWRALISLFSPFSRSISIISYPSYSILHQFLALPFVLLNAKTPLFVESLSPVLPTRRDLHAYLGRSFA